MERDSELLKSFANRLAELLVAPEGANLMQQLQSAGLLRAGDADRNWASAPSEERAVGPTVLPRPNSVERVGIWERNIAEQRGAFVRSRHTTAEWHLWADVGRIEPRSQKRRVVWCGESAARGYLYDPIFNPATALRKMLESQLGRETVEVVDLAATGIGVEIKELALAASRLEPDVVVMFCGNNWGRIELAGPQADAALRDGGVAGLKRYVEDIVGQRARSLIAAINDNNRNKSVHGVLIVPEVNLGDWYEADRDAPYLLDGAANAEWIRVCRDANDAMSRCDWDSAGRYALRIAGLDQGVTSRGAHIMAICHRQQGADTEARRCLEQARDAVIWDHVSNVAPRSFSVVQDALRGAWSDRSTVVDLPALFQADLDMRIPDRRLFLDYCHLTSDGIRFATAAAASAVIRLVSGSSVPFRSLCDQSPTPSPRIRSDAAFLAAIHNAQFGQPAELIQHYCRQALELCPDIATTMKQYLSLQSMACPPMMCRQAQDFIASTSTQLQHYVLRGWTNHRLDAVLFDAVAESLEAVGVTARTGFHLIQREEHTVRRRGVDLLDFYYLSSLQQHRESLWKLSPTLSQFYRAYSARSRFAFVADGNHAVRLLLCCRLPTTAALERVVSIAVNGVLDAEAVVTSEWSTCEIDVNGDHVRAGVNEVELRWPERDFPGRPAIEAAASDMLRRITPEFFPIFGEIYSFFASGTDALDAELGHA